MTGPRERWRWLGTPTRWWAVSTAFVITASAVFVLLQWPDAHARAAESPNPGQAEQISLNPAGFGAVGCPGGAAITPVGYDVGETFEGQSETGHEDICNVPPSGAPIESGPTKAVGYLDVSYGECSEPNGEGCAPPLDIQSWPECARVPKSYHSSSESAEEPGDGAEEIQSLEAAPKIPVASFEHGRRFEVYTGTTTVVVFAAEPGLAKRAATAIAASAAAAEPSESAQALRTEAEQSGDATSCPDLLAQ